MARLNNSVKKGPVMSAINWNSGKLITLTQGDTATIEGLNSGQVYGFFFYNAAQNDATTIVDVTWSNAHPPQQVPVYGTTANQGLASVLLMSGDDSNTVAASILQGNPGADVQAFVCSVKMPVDTSGINNQPLPANGQPQAFRRFTRYFDVPASHWYDVTIESDVDQFIVVQFTEEMAEVIVVKSVANPKENVFPVGRVEKDKLFSIQPTEDERIQVNLQGDGTQTVWMNADSVQNSQNATITLQSLTARDGRPRQRQDPALPV
ncbi:hypothetical protein [Actinophytocola gossypii]|uniref:Uncharacterized protein n=1 Tax=Actinophytocola gossypii TaxID=2812003 RepID=A0ABT2JI29_9PSEU|nr:hypothetical protein [Actinophytocola gossypii]MCT2587534.1 hypothetical protein [Actinophytocola gossypii]